MHSHVKLTVEKKELFIVLPYLGNLPLVLRTRLENIITKNLPDCKMKVIFKSTTRLIKLFRFKDKVVFNLRFNLLYKSSCCAYYSKTCQHLNVKVGEHSGVSPLTGKTSEYKAIAAVKDHMLFCDHVVSLEVFKILASVNSEFHHKIKENLLI